MNPVFGSFFICPGQISLVASVMVSGMMRSDGTPGRLIIWCFLPTKCTYVTISGFFICAGQISLVALVMVSGVKRSIGTPGGFWLDVFLPAICTYVTISVFYLPSADLVGSIGDGIRHEAFRWNAWMVNHFVFLPTRCTYGTSSGLFICLRQISLVEMVMVSGVERSIGTPGDFSIPISLPARCKSGFTFTLFLSNPIDLLAEKRFNKSRFTSWSVSKNNFLGSVSRY
ncbi:hypothetical protein [Dyadobacter diqingensis]|uniref:hypothetical protein n=1 Tax=Dyadobacter diqingensis TaxID=2938121 RepID=UPI0020C1B78B|nr:hypothetical protein [Dyadobacter diqingensis]